MSLVVMTCVVGGVMVGVVVGGCSTHSARESAGRVEEGGPSVEAGEPHGIGERAAPVAGERDVAGALGEERHKAAEGPLIVILALGVNHSCALERGVLRCWGLNRDGILGVGEPRVDEVLVPEPVRGLPPVIAVDADYDFTCALVEGGAVYCWGEDDHGQLGDGLSKRSSRPARVDVPPADGIVVGFRRACAATGGGYQCWGSGELGDGSEHYSDPAQPIAGLAGVDELVLSGGHACTREGAKVRCWGGNSRGQLGNGEGGCRFTREACPGSRCRPPQECKEEPEPVAPLGLPEVVAITVGGSRSYALDGDGAVWSWGQYGMTMDFGDANPSYRPQVFAGIPAVVEVLAEGGHACGRTEAGELWCWGQNAFGELGHGPTPLGGMEGPSQVEGLAPVRGFALGFHHTCAITGEDGAEVVFCWGDNSHGQLGDGTIERRHRPVEVRL